MRKSGGEILQFDPEIERTCRKNRKEARKAASTALMDMAEGSNNTQNIVPIDAEIRALRDYALPTVGNASAIRRPTIAANNFEIKPAIIQMVQNNQFSGAPNDDANAHIDNFLEICDTFKHNGVTDDAIRLRLFPFSLRDKAKSWLNSLPSGSITTWDILAQKFLAKFFPPAKTARLRTEIATFRQLEGESLYETWERFKDLLRRCPHHGVADWLQLHTFYNGLGSSTRTLVDAAAGGALLGKPHQAAWDLLEEMAANAYQWPSERAVPKKVFGIQENDVLTRLSTQVETLAKQLGNLTANAIHTQSASCDFCGGDHSNGQCDENQTDQAFFVGNRQQNNPYSNTYNPGWRNHPNFSWKNNDQPRQSYPPPPQQQQTNKPSLEEALAQLTVSTTQFMTRTDTTLQNQAASIRNLEVQMGQISNLLTARPQGSLPSNTETNPREHLKAVTLRSGKMLKEPVKRTD